MIIRTDANNKRRKDGVGDTEYGSHPSENGEGVYVLGYCCTPIGLRMRAYVSSEVGQWKSARTTVRSAGYARASDMGDLT